MAVFFCTGTSRGIFIRNFTRIITRKVTVQEQRCQGSIIGPLLFVLFINDMHKCVSPGTKISLYADDTKCWRQIDSYQDHLILQKDISSLLEWSHINKMRFHPDDKCKVVKVTFKTEKYMDLFPYRLGDHHLPHVQCEKDLGVRITPRLNWSEQCKALCSKANSRLGLVKRTCHFVLSEKQRRVMYLAMVRSQFEHCSLIWRPSTKTMLNKIEAIQKKAVKWIYGEEYNVHPLGTQRKYTTVNSWSWIYFPWNRDLHIYTQTFCTVLSQNPYQGYLCKTPGVHWSYTHWGSHSCSKHRRWKSSQVAFYPQRSTILCM